jgi:hypothetical protein
MIEGRIRTRAAEHEQVKAVVDVVPEAGVAEHVASARAALAGKAVGALAVLARVAVAVGVQVEDGVVGRGALELEAGLVVVVGRQALVVVVRGIAGVDAVGAVDQPAWSQNGRQETSKRSRGSYSRL